MPAAQRSRHIGGFFVIWEQGSGPGRAARADDGRQHGGVCARAGMGQRPGSHGVMVASVGGEPVPWCRNVQDMRSHGAECGEPGEKFKKREKKAEKSLPFGRRLNRIEEYMPLGDRSSMDSTRRKRTNSEGSRR